MDCKKMTDGQIRQTVEKYILAIWALGSKRQQWYIDQIDLLIEELARRQITMR